MTERGPGRNADSRTDHAWILVCAAALAITATILWILVARDPRPDLGSVTEAVANSQAAAVLRQRDQHTQESPKEVERDSPAMSRGDAVSQEGITGDIRCAETQEPSGDDVLQSLCRASECSSSAVGSSLVRKAIPQIIGSPTESRVLALVKALEALQDEELDEFVVFSPDLFRLPPIRMAMRAREAPGTQKAVRMAEAMTGDFEALTFLESVTIAQPGAGIPEASDLLFVAGVLLQEVQDDQLLLLEELLARTRALYEQAGSKLPAFMSNRAFQQLNRQRKALYLELVTH